MIIIIIVIAWFISPIVFIPLFIIYLNKYNKEHIKNDGLKKQISYLLNNANVSDKDNNNSNTNPQNFARHNFSEMPQTFNNPQTQYYQQPSFNSDEVKPLPTQKVDDEILEMPLNNLQPTFSTQPIAREKANKKPSSVSTINIVLIVGVVFIILAGIIFTTTTWQDIPNFFRTIIVFSVTAFFFGVSLFAEKKLKLAKTSVAFYFLGSIFLPISMISVGFFKLFGNWLTLNGDGRYVLLLLASFLLGVAGFLGTQKYHMKSLAYTFYSCITIFIICLMKSFYLNNNIFVLCLSIISTIIIFAVSHISKKESEKYNLLLSCIQIFAIINTCILGSISILVSDNTGIASLSTFIFAFVFLKNIFNPEKQSSGAYPFVVLIFIGLYKFIIPENISDYMMLTTAAAVTLAIVGQMGQLNEKLVKLLHIISVISVSISYLFLGLPLSLSNSWTGITLITGSIMLVNLTWLAVKYKNNNSLLFQPIFLIILIQGFVSYIIDSTLWACAIMSVFSLLAFILYKKIKFLRTNSSDVLFSFIPLICMFVSLGIGNDRHLKSIGILNNYGFYMLICSVILVSIVSLIVFEKNKVRTELNKFFEWLLPVSISSIIYSIYSITEKSAQLHFFIYFIIIILASIFSIIFEKRKKAVQKFTEYLEIYSFSLTTIALFIISYRFNNNYIYPYLWISSLFFGVKTYFLNKENNIKIKNVFSHLTSSSIIVASIITTENLTNLMQDFASSKINLELFACAIMSVFSLLAFILYKKFKFLRTNSSDVLFSFIPLICMFISLGIGNARHLKSIGILNNYGFYMLICSVIFVSIVSLIVFEKNKVRTELNKFFEWLLPVSISSIIYSIYSITEKSAQLHFFIYFIIIILASIFSIIFEKRKSIFLQFSKCLEIYSLSLTTIAFVITIINFDNKYIYPYFWFSSLFFVIKSCFSHKEENYKVRNFYFYLSCFFVILTSVVTTSNFNNEKSLSILVATIFTLLFFVFYMSYKKIFKKEMLISFQFKTFVAVATALESLSLIFCLFLKNLSITYFIVCAISIAVSYFMFLRRKNNILAFIPTFFIFPFISISLNQPEIIHASTIINIISIIIFVLIAFLAKIIHKKVFSMNEKKSIIIDWLSLMNIFVIFNIHSEKYSEFIILAIISIYPLIFFNRLAKNTANPYILTTSCFFAVLSFWAQPFFSIANAIKAEINSIPIILFCVAFFYIWKNKKKMADLVCFFFAIIIIGYLSIDAMIHELLLDALLLAVAMLIMVIISYIKKRKTWFILSVSVLVFLTIYLSRSFWFSLEWWIYLLSTGIILIVIASINEIQKQKGSSLKNKASRFLSEWTW